MKKTGAKLVAQSTWEVKRRLRLPAMTHERDAQVVTARVAGLVGVRGARADSRRHRLTIVYDITRLYYREILDEVAEAGFPVPDGRWSRFKASWFQGLDETGRGNANAPTPPCCSDPKGIVGPKKRL